MVEEVALVRLVPGNTIGLQWPEVEATDQIGLNQPLPEGLVVGQRRHR